MKKVKDKIQSFDILGESFALNYQDSNQYSTCPGGLLSCCAVTLVLTAFSLLAYQYIDTKSPTITISTEISSDFPKFDLYEDQFTPVFALSFFDKPRDPSQSFESFVTVQATFFERKINFETDPISFTDDLTIVPFVNCTLIDPFLLEPFMTNE